MGASPTSGMVTITFGVAQTGCAWSIIQLTGVDISGTNGSGAVVQWNTNGGAGVTSLTVNLSAFGDPGNATAGGFATNLNAAASAGTGFTYIMGAGYSNPTTHIDTEWRSTNDTSVDMSFPSSADALGIGVEVRAARVRQIEIVAQSQNRASNF
jgi:hypothetical protein